MAWYHHPALVYARADDPDLPAFYYDPMINPISSRSLETDQITTQEDELFGEEDFDTTFTLPEGVDPFLEEYELETDHTAGAIELYWAPAPFNKKSGYCKRAIDVPLVKNWYLEHCPPNQPGAR